MNGQIIKAYTRERIKSWILYWLSILFFFALAALYGYADVTKNMSYGIFVIFFFWMVYVAYGFTRYRRKCGSLLGEAGEGEKEGRLPPAESLPERSYQRIIFEKENEKRCLITEYDERKRDMADYYTMWIHQIKTPIAALGLLLEEKDRAQREELFQIEQYAEMALHYARLESLSSDLLLQMQDIRAIIIQAVKKYAVFFIGSGLSFHLEEFSCRAVSDEKWMAFVIEQILSNALKYTREGGISIYGADPEGGLLMGEVSYVVIEDTGVGIRGEDLPRIFERGFTGYNGRLDKRSTGIGLYLCRQITDRLAHTMRVWSEVGKGTRVILGFARNVTET